MLSVIVSSPSPLSSSAHRRNVAGTVGASHEYLRVPNSGGRMGLAAAYNLGAARAKGEVLVFVHEDADFLAKGWGRLLESKFRADPSLGLIGVAGTRRLGRRDLRWEAAGAPHLRGRVVIEHPDGTRALSVFSWDRADGEVVALDGVFLALRRALFASGQSRGVRFDAKTFDGFHFYDLDLAMQVRRTHRVVAAWDILLSHRSTGRYDAAWVSAAGRFRKKYDADLPAACAGASGSRGGGARVRHFDLEGEGGQVLGRLGLLPAEALRPKARRPASASSLSAVRELHLYLGNACNHRCAMCFQADFKKTLDRSVYSEKLRPVYPHLKTAVLQGGEPTVLPQAREFAEIVLQVNPRVRLGVLTNGERFEGWWMTRFLEHARFVNFSLNAAAPSTYRKITAKGDWDRVLANVRETVSRAPASCEVRLSLVVLEQNMRELVDFVQLAERLGASAVQFMHDPSLLPKGSPLLLRELSAVRGLERKLRGKLDVRGLAAIESLLSGRPLPSHKDCRRPWEQVFVGVEGDVGWCCLLGGTLGNLKDTTLEELWNSPKALRLRAAFKSKEAGACLHRCAGAPG
ncbi:MAG: glycosyltransferase [Elusimicrobiota bacterium]|jgi:MoaA/NifB/PqqE/SkfB family radical SAM enzyme